MRFFDKKGITKTELAGLMLATVAILIIINPFINVTKIAKASTDVEKCRLSIVAASMDISYGVKAWKFTLFTARAPNPFRIDCSKRYAYISEDVVSADDVDKEIPKIEDNEPEERERLLKDFVLGEMTKCWRSFGDASDKVYMASPEEGGGSVEPGEDEAACFACSEVLISEDFQATELRDFYAYANNKMRLTGESYVEFLTGGSSPGITEDKSITLEPGQQWSTIFMLKELENSAFLPLFRNNLPKINSGIVNCFMVAEDDDGNLVQAKYGGASIGCENGIDGFVFGKVAAGYDKNTILGLGGTDVRFPMTVRFIPTEEVFKPRGQCDRLY